MDLFSLLICEAPNIEKEHIIYNKFRYVENRDTDKFPAKEKYICTVIFVPQPFQKKQIALNSKFSLLERKLSNGS